MTIEGIRNLFDPVDAEDIKKRAKIMVDLYGGEASKINTKTVEALAHQKMLDRIMQENEFFGARMITPHPGMKFPRPDPETAEKFIQTFRNLIPVKPTGEDVAQEIRYLIPDLKPFLPEDHGFVFITRDRNGKPCIPKEDKDFFTITYANSAYYSRQVFDQSMTSAMKVLAGKERAEDPKAAFAEYFDYITNNPMHSLFPVIGKDPNTPEVKVTLLPRGLFAKGEKQWTTPKRRW